MSSLWFWCFTLILFFHSRFVFCLLFHSNSSLVISLHMLFAIFALNFIFLQNLRTKNWSKWNYLRHTQSSTSCKKVPKTPFALFFFFLFTFFNFSFLSFCNLGFAFHVFLIICLILCKRGQVCCYFKILFFTSIWFLIASFLLQILKFFFFFGIFILVLMLLALNCSIVLLCNNVCFSLDINAYLMRKLVPLM